MLEYEGKLDIQIEVWGRTLVQGWLMLGEFTQPDWVAVLVLGSSWVVQPVLHAHAHIIFIYNTHIIFIYNTHTHIYIYIYTYVYVYLFYTYWMYFSP